MNGRGGVNGRGIAGRRPGKPGPGNRKSAANPLAVPSNRRYNKPNQSPPRLTAMHKTVTAKVINGVLTPLEPITLEEGVEYRMTLKDTRPISEQPNFEADMEAFRATAGVWRDRREYWENFIQTMYAAREAGSREPSDP